jgi:hypothetical protein
MHCTKQALRNITISWITIFLLCHATTHSMQLAPLENTSHDIFSTIIIPHLNRQDKSILRCVSMKMNRIVPSQDELNKKYITAHTENNIPAMILWKQMGGLLPYQELVHALNTCKDGKYILARWLMSTHRIEFYDALKASIADNDEVIMILLLNKWKPQPENNKELDECFECAVQRKNTAISTLSTLFLNYYVENTPHYRGTDSPCWFW